MGPGELRSGHFTVGADGSYFVMELLAAFIGCYPGVRVSVAMGNSQSVIEVLMEYRADVAVLAWVRVDVVSRAELGDDARLESWEYLVCLRERRNLRTVKAFLSLIEEAKASRSDAAVPVAEAPAAME